MVICLCLCKQVKLIKARVSMHLATRLVSMSKHVILYTLYCNMCTTLHDCHILFCVGGAPSNFLEWIYSSGPTQHKHGKKFVARKI